MQYWGITLIRVNPTLLEVTLSLLREVYTRTEQIMYYLKATLLLQPNSITLVISASLHALYKYLHFS